jgi:membrane dipeptidase
MGVEGGHQIEQSPAVLRVFYELGARYMTLTHFGNTPWADSATDMPVQYGLTDFGRDLVREMNRIGMFADISHVSADTMRDVLRVTRAPVIFSHSSAYALNPHPRNVPDEILKMLPANGGVCHVNFIRVFVSREGVAWQDKRAAALREIHGRISNQAEIDKAIKAWEESTGQPKATLSDVADHIDHIRKVAGIDHIGIGADYFGVDPTLMADGMAGMSCYPYLFAELLRRGYSDEDVLKIAGRNHLRALRAMEKVAAELRHTEKPLNTEPAVPG